MLINSNIALTFALIIAVAVLGGGRFTGTSENQAEIRRPAIINYDADTSKKINYITKNAALQHQKHSNNAIDFISGEFLDTPYRGGMLIGSENTPEELVVDFSGLDCTTYIEYVESLRKSVSEQDFLDNLIRTRYINGNVSFLSRRHFFSDWAYSKENNLAADITAQVSSAAISVKKDLNRKSDGTAYVSGLPVVSRSINYIPGALITDKIVGNLQSGDLIGIYTSLPGLDVTHVGIFINTEKGPVLRNSSSRAENRKVVDSPFLEYVAKTTGIIVFRPKPQKPNWN